MYVGTLWVQDLGNFSRPFNKALGLTIDILWWYRPFLYGGLYPICFFKEFCFGGFVFVI